MELCVIVLDEQLAAPLLAEQIAAWYKGAVIVISQLRPDGRLLDEEIPRLLLQMRAPTFVTINYDDFCRPRLLHAKYCLICFRLPQLEAHRVPVLLRAILSDERYNTKAKRMGTIILWTPSETTHLTL
jgi:hypothetical protein